MKKITVINNELFNRNIEELMKTFSLKLVEDLEISSIASKDKGFKIDKNDSTVMIYYSCGINYFYNAAWPMYL